MPLDASLSFTPLLTSPDEPNLCMQYIIMKKQKRARPSPPARLKGTISDAGYRITKPNECYLYSELIPTNIIAEIRIYNS